MIDADYGYESGTEQKGAIRLRAGLHPFHLYYMRRTKGKPLLEFKWQGPGITKEPVPAEVFFRNAAPNSASD